jgi:hypothetical protein
LLQQLNTLGRALPGDATVKALYASEQQAYELILGDAGKLFDLSQEPDALRDRYGRNTFGQSCLMARRLVEKGVPYVTINYKGWDTHKTHFPIMRRKLPELDKGFATLLQDLSERGLLASTIIWWSGEFWPHTQSAVGSPVERRAQSLWPRLLGGRGGGAVSRAARCGGRVPTPPARSFRAGRFIPAICWQHVCVDGHLTPPPGCRIRRVHWRG